jgi:phosphatidylglycerol:prolipoprotein diacylglycerol transferase
MSFHGGLVGVIIATTVFSKWRKIPFLTLTDQLALAVPIALGLGRIGNYINGELIGFAPYNGPLAMMVNGIGHFPSPLLEALLEGPILL